MQSSGIAGLEKPLSRLVMGVDNQTTLDQAARMFDDYVSRGGNVFDTAYVYGKGVCEAVFGEWLESRGLRQKVVLIGKGAHTPHCTPEALRAQLLESLGRMRVSHVDIYFMHRDNPEIPVGEFVDVLNEHHSAGQIGIFGASNWTLERVQAANQYAASKRLQGFSAVSNNLSLARMVEPPWVGCVSSKDAAFRGWLEATQTPLFPWSSQARGFFTRAHPDDTRDPELVRSWYSPDNFERLNRARALATQKGVEPIHVALAYVLYQPFPTFPLIGPRTPEETASSFRALEVSLTPQEVRWLDLEADQPA
ncbi:aldo/keto reductase [Meiothermus granaticius]|nr:aldo/keto reductase [Meiothermus granaticius]